MVHLIVTLVSVLCLQNHFLDLGGGGGGGGDVLCNRLP